MFIKKLEIMKKLLLLLLCVPLIAFTQDKYKVFQVYNASQFLDALGSNRIIKLMNTIDLSEIDKNNSYKTWLW